MIVDDNRYGISRIVKLDALNEVNEDDAFVKGSRNLFYL